MTLALLVPEIQSGVRGAPPPPQSQIDQKSPVWIGLRNAVPLLFIGVTFLLANESKGQFEMSDDMENHAHSYYLTLGVVWESPKKHQKHFGTPAKSI